LSGRMKLRECLGALKDLRPTTDEISGYARLLIGKGKAYGRVRSTAGRAYFGPWIHERKRPTSANPKDRIRAHIDLGCSGVQLHLDEAAANGFIGFIRRRRQIA